MKVQTGEDAKAPPSDEKAERSSRSVTIDYELKPAAPQQSAYINVSKLVLLILAIIATFLACLIFARDLWGTKNVEKHQVIHHQKRIAAAPPTENLDRLPLPDDLFDDFPGFPFKNDLKEDRNDKDGVVSKVTKITFRVFPNDKDESPEKVKFPAPMMGDHMMDDLVKTMMDMMGAAGQNDHQVHPHSEENKHNMFDLPMFGGQNAAHHPKLIIIRRIHPSPNNGMDDDMMKNIMDGISGDPRIHEPFPLIPAQPQNVDPLESFFNKINNDFPSIKKIMLRPKKSEPAPVKKESTDAPAAWAEYKSIISKLAKNVDTVLDETESLKSLVDNEIKNKESTAAESSGPGKEDETSKENATQIKDFYADVNETLNKMGIAMTEASVLIKTEDGAMDLIKTTDKKTLMETIDSFTKAILEPLDEVFSASTNLTKTNGNENSIREDIYKGIVDLGNNLIRFGKIVYEDVSGLRKSLDKKDKTEDKPESREIVDSSETIDAKHDSDDSKMAAPGAPKVVRRIVVFNAPLSQLFGQLPMAGLKPEPPFIRRR